MEIEYRKTQRKLGEVDVAIRILCDLARTEESEELTHGIEYLRKVRSGLFKRAKDLEAKAGMCW